MAKTAVAPDTFRKGSKVVARRELRGVPEGTAGKVTLVNGFEWIRYWVLFENGVRLGSINRNALATPDEWKRHLDGDEHVFGDDAAATTDEAEVAAGADDGAASSSGVTLPSGVVIPQKFIERAAAARKRLQG